MLTGQCRIFSWGEGFLEARSDQVEADHCSSSWEEWEGGSSNFLQQLAQTAGRSRPSERKDLEDCSREPEPGRTFSSCSAFRIQTWKTMTAKSDLMTKIFD